MFKGVSRITLQEGCLIVGASDEWTCGEMLGYEYEGRPRPSQTHALQFHLKKVEGKWYVEGRTVGRR